MDTRQKMTARDIVNDYEEKELYRVIRDYGEDKFAKNIAKHIVTERGKEPIVTTGQLTEIVKRAIPMKYQKKSGHPAKRTFQAIRIELNRELEVLRDSLDDMIGLLNPGGTCPADFPVCVCGKVPKGSIVTRKPILPGEEELRENSRSKSAKLRIFERAEQKKAGHLTGRGVLHGSSGKTYK